MRKCITFWGKGVNNLAKMKIKGRFHLQTPDVKTFRSSWNRRFILFSHLSWSIPPPPPPPSPRMCYEWKIPNNPQYKQLAKTTKRAKKTKNVMIVLKNCSEKRKDIFLACQLMWVTAGKRGGYKGYLKYSTTVIISLKSAGRSWWILFSGYYSWPVKFLWYIRGVAAYNQSTIDKQSHWIHSSSICNSTF